MAEKKLTREELDQVGLTCIEIDWGNKQKLVTMFHHFAEKGESLPASGVNDKGDFVPNLSLLARLGKVIQGKQVFNTIYGRVELDKAIRLCGIEDLKTKDGIDETSLVREKMQDTVDAIRHSSSVTDKKLQEALAKARQLTVENNELQASVISLKQELAVANFKLGTANKRIFSIAKHERTTLKRTC